jgi:Fe-S oxidoreductase
MEPLEILHELRKYVVAQGKGPLPGHMPAVESIQKNNNPFGEDLASRAEWAEAMDLPEKGEVLYFPGCYAAYKYPREVPG